jgi:hypothetical protein
VSALQLRATAREAVAATQPERKSGALTRVAAIRAREAADVSRRRTKPAAQWRRLEAVPRVARDIASLHEEEERRCEECRFPLGP